MSDYRSDLRKAQLAAGRLCDYFRVLDLLDRLTEVDSTQGRLTSDAFDVAEYLNELGKTLDLVVPTHPDLQYELSRSGA